MRSPLRKIIFCILLLTLVIGSAFSASAAKAKKKAKLSVKKVTLTVGDKCTVTLKNAKSKVKWKVKSKKIASIKAKGKSKVVITAKKAGTTKVYGTYKGKKYTCTVKVVAKQTPGGDSSSSSSSSSWSSGSDDSSGGGSSGGGSQGSSSELPDSMQIYVDEFGTFKQNWPELTAAEKSAVPGVFAGWKIDNKFKVYLRDSNHTFSFSDDGSCFDVINVSGEINDNPAEIHLGLYAEDASGIVKRITDVRGNLGYSYGAPEGSDEYTSNYGCNGGFSPDGTAYDIKKTSASYQVTFHFKVMGRLETTIRLKSVS